MGDIPNCAGIPVALAILWINGFNIAVAWGNNWLRFLEMPLFVLSNKERTYVGWRFVIVAPIKVITIRVNRVLVVRAEVRGP